MKRFADECLLLGCSEFGYVEEQVAQKKKKGWWWEKEDT